MQRALILAALVLAACGDSAAPGGGEPSGGQGGGGAGAAQGGSPANGGSDAAGGAGFVEDPRKVEGDPVPASPEEIFPPIVPDTFTEVWLGGCTFGDYEMERGWVDTFDQCAICQCTSWGLRCAKRVGCPTDECIFVDGTILSPGQSALVAGCFLCACDENGGSCERYVGGACPEDGCLVPSTGNILELGSQAFFSECHACTCDPEQNLLCENLCHPECVAVDGDGNLQVLGLDQEHVQDDEDCGHCICDYSEIVCDTRCR